MIRIRLTVEERQLIEAAAKAAGLSMTSLLIEAARGREIGADLHGEVACQGRLAAASGGNP